MILVGIMVNLKIKLGSVAILMLSLLIHEHRMSFNLLMTLISFKIVW